MIDAKELRIGNYLTACLTKELVEVDWLVMKHIQDNGNVQAAPYDMSSVYEPIPLTEDWLLKLGLEKDRAPNCYVSSSNDFVIFTENKANDIFVPYVPAGKYIVLVKSVHQLQNLYHSLTGKELTINEQHA